MESKLSTFITCVFMFVGVLAFAVVPQIQPKPVPDCITVKDGDVSKLLCREDYKPATASQKEAFCREQWRQFLKPYRQSGRPPTNASMEGCEDVSQPRFTDEELERP